MQSAAQTEHRAEGSLCELFLEPTAEVEVLVAAQRSPDDGTEGSLCELFVEPTMKLNGQAEAGAEGSLCE